MSIIIVILVCLLTYLVDAFGLIKYQIPHISTKQVSTGMLLVFDECRFIFWVSYICCCFVMIMDAPARLEIELFTVLNLVIMLPTVFMVEKRISRHRNLRLIVGIIGMLTGLALL